MSTEGDLIRGAQHLSKAAKLLARHDKEKGVADQALSIHIKHFRIQYKLNLAAKELSDA